MAWAASLWEELKIPKDDRCLEMKSSEVFEHVQYVLEFRGATMGVLGAIRQREDALTDLKDHLDNPETYLEALDAASGDVIAHIAAWNCYRWRPMAFLWRGQDYLEKMREDISFLRLESGDDGKTERTKPERRLYNALGPWRSGTLLWDSPREASSRRDVQDSLLQNWIWRRLTPQNNKSFASLARDVRKVASEIRKDFEDRAKCHEYLVDSLTLARAVDREDRYLRKAGITLPYLRCPSLGQTLRRAVAAVVGAKRDTIPHDLYVTSAPSRLRRTVERSQKYTLDDQFYDLYDQRLRGSSSSWAQKRRRQHRPFSASGLPPKRTPPTRPMSAPATNPVQTKKKKKKKKKPKMTLQIPTDDSCSSLDDDDERSPPTTTRRRTPVKMSMKTPTTCEKKRAKVTFAAVDDAEEKNEKVLKRPQSAMARKRRISTAVPSDDVQEAPISARTWPPRGRYAGTDDLAVLETNLVPTTPQSLAAGEHRCNVVNTVPLLEVLDHPFKLQHLPTGYASSHHAWTLWDVVPAVRCDDDKRRTRIRQLHWQGNYLSGVYGLDEAEVKSTRWDPNRGWHDHDGECVHEGSITWCLRRGQRLALVRGGRPNEIVWAQATVANLNNGTYLLSMDNGAGLRYDPTCRRRQSFIFENLKVNSKSNTTATFRAFGFDVDDRYSVVRVDDGTEAARLGIQHGWVVTRIEGQDVSQPGCGRERLGAAVETILKELQTVEVEFYVFSHVLCAPNNMYQPGQRLSYFHITQWCDAIVLRPPQPRTPVEAFEIDNGMHVRLRVFMGSRGDLLTGTVETVTTTLNASNHCLRFLDSATYLEHLRTWQRDRLEWGEMFDTVKRRCQFFARSRRRLSSKEMTAARTRRSSKPAVLDRTCDVIQRKKTVPDTTAPQVYDLVADPDFIKSGVEVAPNGVHWADVRSLDTLTSVLLHHGGGDLRTGRDAPVRVLLVDKLHSARFVPTRAEQIGFLHKDDEWGSSRTGFSATTASTRTLSMRSLKTPSNASEVDLNDDDDEEEKGEEKGGSRLLMHQAITLAESAMKKVNLDHVRSKAAETAAVEAAAKKISTAWIRRSMAHYADIRTPIGQLRSLLMTLSATSQDGHPTAQYVPLLVKKESLLRSARKLLETGGLDDKAPSILQLYFESAYARSRPALYRMLMQLLLSRKLILLFDAAKSPQRVEPAISHQGTFYSPEELDSQDRLKALALVDKYVAERLPLEVSRLVIAGELAPPDEARLRQRCLTYIVQRGSRKDHEAGINAWYERQKGRFSSSSSAMSPLAVTTIEVG